MAIMEQAYNSLPYTSDELKKKLLEIDAQKNMRVADIMPANENVIRGNPMLLETQLANLREHPEYKKYQARIASMNNEVIPSQYTPPTAQEENDVASIPVEQSAPPQVEAPVQTPVETTAQPIVKAPEQPFDYKPLGLGIARGVGLLGDVFRGDTENKTQAAITADINREREYLRQKLLDSQKMQTGIDEKDDPNSEISIRSVETLASLYPDFADTFAGKSYNENNRYVQYVNTLTAEQRRAEAEKRRQELSASARAESKAKMSAEEEKKNKELMIPGLDIFSGYRPSIDDKKKAQSVYNDYVKFKNIADKLLVEKDVNKIAQLRTDLLMVKKSIDELGVLTGPDMGLLNDQLNGLVTTPLSKLAADKSLVNSMLDTMGKNTRATLNIYKYDIPKSAQIQTSSKIYRYKVNGKIYNVPENGIDAFAQKYPDAEEIE